MNSKEASWDRARTERTDILAAEPARDLPSLRRPDSGASPGNAPPSDYLTLAQAAALAPGRPSANCTWRWCRRGVLARTGLRVRLQHVRQGGRVYTKAAWVEAFGRDLAEADRQYFEPDPPSASIAKGRVETPPRARGDEAETPAAARDRAVTVEAQLDAEGL